MSAGVAVTGQLTDATGDYACLVFVLLAALRDRELSSPRLVQSASCRIPELSRYRCGGVQGLDRDDRTMLATVPENGDSDVTDSTTQHRRDEVVTCTGDRKSRDGGIDVSAQSRSYSDGGGNMR